MNSAAPRVHPTAEVSERATLGEGTSVWNPAQIRGGARLGRGCIVSKDVYVDFVIGDFAKIQKGGCCTTGSAGDARHLAHVGHEPTRHHALGSSPEIAETMRLLYARVVRADVDATDLTTAELVKTGENAFRDVQIAFANQLARVCEDSGADFLEVRRLVNRSPGRNVLFAGAGVGGHCIPKDPWLLAAGASVELPLIEAARVVNEAMPARVGELVLEALGVSSLDGKTIAVLGQAYLEGSDDDRNSPTDALVAWAKARGATVRVHDPFVAGFDRSLDAVVRGADAIVVMVAHAEYRTLDLNRVGALVRGRVLVDGRRVIDLAAARNAGWTTRAIGLSSSRS